MGGIASIFREEKSVILFVGGVILLYYLCMDFVLYTTFQTTSLVDEASEPVSKVHSPFHPLSIKLITLDQNSHYFFKPTAELFNYVTNFSNVFYFISPNMISASHVLVGLVVGKLVSSDSLRTRRYGALLYQFRTWLDSLDGVVYRSRKGQTTYNFQGNDIGSKIDNRCDVMGGVALCVGTVYYLIKRFENNGDELPTRTKNGVDGPVVVVKNSVPSRKHLLVKMALYGALVGIAGSQWEHFVTNAEQVFERKQSDPQVTALQTTLLHQCSTWVVFWSWKLVGQQLLQYLIVAIVVDRVWEFLNFGLFVGYPVVVTLILSSCFYIKYLHSALYGAEVMRGMDTIIVPSTPLPAH